METKLTTEERKQIEEGIHQKYARVSESPEGLFAYPTGRAGLKALKYDPEMIQTLPEIVLASYCGVGNPFSLGPINKGETVLDIGCGGGVDTFVAAIMVGPEGKVVGIDLVPEMLERAKANLKKTSLKNVTFQESSAEQLPFLDGTFDIVISNGVFNLIPDKAKALREVFRVLKLSGRFLLADQVLTGELPENMKIRVDNWFRWEGGAIPGKDFLALLMEAGFVDAELVAETGFNSSPVTKGVLFRAKKPEISSVGKTVKLSKDLLGKYQVFFDSVYGEGVLDRKTKHLIALGASLAAGCEPWTQYCLAVARELGTTDEELRETMAIAMSVGVTKIQILQEKAISSLPETTSSEIQMEHGEETQTEQEVSAAWPTQSRSG